MSNFGTNVVIGAKASRPIVIESQTPIFIVGTVVLSTLTTGTDDDGKPIINKDLQAKIKEKNGLLFYGKPDDAKADFVESTGTLRNVLDGITDQNVATKLIIAIVTITKEQSEKKTPETFYDTPTIKSNIMNPLEQSLQNLIAQTEDLLNKKIISNPREAERYLKLAEEELYNRNYGKSY
jgi:hypothetical protein